MLHVHYIVETEKYLSVPNLLLTIAYVYADVSWKDKLTSYDGKDITYDNIGNPTKYNGWAFTWEQGRQLSGMSKTGMDISFKYNDSGIRTQKTINGVTTNYYLDGDRITYEDNGTDKIYYTYDSTGSLVSMNLNGVEYYYIRNAQNDIIGLFDKNETAVASYTYDSWGKLISIKDGSGADITNNTDSVGYKNQYRYRGYRYDIETGLYYLQSRYYNPEWERFINADGLVGTPGELLSFNMFAYCGNNPVNRDDPNGQSWGALLARVGVVFAIPAEVATLITVAVVAIAILTVLAIVDVAIQEYRNHHVTYTDSTTPTGNKTASPPQNKTRPSSSGKAKNKLRPDPNAYGDHTTFKRDPNTGEITNYGTWKSNPKNPTGFDSEKRYDRIGESHFNKVTREKLLPHVHDKTAPGGIRNPIPWEVPIKR